MQLKGIWQLRRWPIMHVQATTATADDRLDIACRLAMTGFSVPLTLPFI